VETEVICMDLYTHRTAVQCLRRCKPWKEVLLCENEAFMEEEIQVT